MKKVLISILSLIFIVSMITTVYAAEGSVTLSASASEVIKGKTFTVTIVAKGDSNVTGMEGKLSYKNKELSLEEKEVIAKGFAEAGAGNELNTAILSLDGITLSKSVTLYKLTFKVLETAAEGETEISLTDIVLGLVEGVATAPNASVKVNIKTEEIPTPEDPEEPEEPEDPEEPEEPEDPEDNPTNPDNGANKPNSGNSGNKKPATKLPQTGVESASIFGIIALGVISIVSYILYRKYRNI